MIKYLLEHISIFPYNNRNHMFVRHMPRAEIQLEHHSGCSGYLWLMSMHIGQGQCLIWKCLCYE